LLDFAASMLSCKTLNGVREQFRIEVVRHGYRTSSCAVVAPQGGARTPQDNDPKLDLLFHNWPQDWTSLRDRTGVAAKRFAAAEASMILAEGRRRMAPFSWSDIGKERGLSAAERETCDDLTASGWRDGFLTPIHGPGGYLAIVALASNERDLDLSAQKRQQLQLTAMLAHERVCALAKLAAVERPIDIMSARELECLRWVAAGKTDWEIGMILSISATTVKFHLNGARAKLGARTRAQAVARLVLYGLY
jgi:LuxR family quorum sensing-dependent transcriptional regulator